MKLFLFTGVSITKLEALKCKDQMGYRILISVFIMMPLPNKHSTK